MTTLSLRILLEACARLSDAAFGAPRVGFFLSLHMTLNHILLVDRCYLADLKGEERKIKENKIPFPRATDLAVDQGATDRELVVICDGLAEADLDRIVPIDPQRQHRLSRDIPRSSLRALDPLSRAGGGSAAARGVLPGLRRPGSRGRPCAARAIGSGRGPAPAAPEVSSSTKRPRRRHWRASSSTRTGTGGATDRRPVRTWLVALLQCRLTAEGKKARGGAIVATTLESFFKEVRPIFDQRKTVH